MIVLAIVVKNEYVRLRDRKFLCGGADGIENVSFRYDKSSLRCLEIVL